MSKYYMFLMLRTYIMRGKLKKSENMDNLRLATKNKKYFRLKLCQGGSFLHPLT